MSPDLRSFGEELRNLRERRGISQKEVIARIPGRYSSEGAYGRVEQGTRRPDRATLVDILVKGLKETSRDIVDKFLHWAGYEALTDSESNALGVRGVADQNVDKVLATPADGLEGPVAPGRPTIIIGAFVLLVLLIASVLVAIRVEVPLLFVLLTSSLYGGLFVVSILLETAYTASSRKIVAVAAVVFVFMLTTSVLALSLDAARLPSGRTGSFLMALAVFLVSSVAQWFVARFVLPAEGIVPVDFEPHTAQAAHLKNTVYFLSAVAIFWLPAFHGAGTIRQDLLRGERAAAAAAIASARGFAPGLLLPGTAWLWVALLLLVIATLVMRASIIDHLRQHPARNRFLILFYTRALLYFSLGLVCVVWYSETVDAIAGATAN